MPTVMEIEAGLSPATRAWWRENVRGPGGPAVLVRHAVFTGRVAEFFFRHELEERRLRDGLRRLGLARHQVQRCIVTWRGGKGPARHDAWLRRAWALTQPPARPRARRAGRRAP